MNLWKILSRLSRNGRYRFFWETMNPLPTERLLDLGAGMGDMLECRYPWIDKIIAVDKVLWGGGTPILKNFLNISIIQSDGCLLPFRDEAFDIVFSNAVIEHVNDQQKFANEIQRVGRRYFVSTPNRWFPLETHSKLFFIHYLPSRIAWKIIPLLSKYKEETKLLSPRQMKKLFPNAKIVCRGLGIIAFHV
jgi:ubiquinone/menaquinone biosynthesis C-methylase UbiE